jgi:hypothetical protein
LLAQDGRPNWGFGLGCKRSAKHVEFRTVLFDRTVSLLFFGNTKNSQLFLIQTSVNSCFRNIPLHAYVENLKLATKQTCCKCWCSSMGERERACWLMGLIFVGRSQCQKNKKILAQMSSGPSMMEGIWALLCNLSCFSPSSLTPI